MTVLKSGSGVCVPPFESGGFGTAFPHEVQRRRFPSVAYSGSDPSDFQGQVGKAMRLLPVWLGQGPSRNPRTRSPLSPARLTRHRASEKNRPDRAAQPSSHRSTTMTPACGTWSGRLKQPSLIRSPAPENHAI